MEKLRRLFTFLNPLAQLGNKEYSARFALLTTLGFCIISEIFAYAVVHNPLIVGLYAIFIPVVFIIYFAFRDGIRGGVIAAVITILYYFYIIFSRHYRGAQFESGIDTALILAALYLVLSVTIGWLKQTIDTLLENEANEKRRLQTIIEQLPVGVLITDSRGRLTQRNKQIDKILGAKIPLGFVIGEDVLSNAKINGDKIQPGESPLAKALISRRVLVNQEMLYERKDGIKRYLQVSSSPILNRDKEIFAAASIISDITGQKELEKQKDEFLGIASHELKTPVTSLKAYGQVLQKRFQKAGDANASTMLLKMDAQINKLTNLIQDLLDISKIEGGQLRFQNERFVFDELVEEIVEEIQRTTDRQKIVLTGASKKTIYGDRERIGQVITNFLTNAIKYSPEGKEILVKVSAKDGQVKLSVQDHGVGIPADKLTRVFERFYRVPGKMHDTVPGMGIGLYISREIIRRQGGEVWADSVPGKGATFSFSLPVTSNKE